MQLHELKATGTYVCVAPTDATLALLQEWALKNKISLDNDLHVTLLYSRKIVNPVRSIAQYLAEPAGIVKLGEAIVVKLKCPSLVARHEELIAVGGTHDFPSFIPHMTLIAKPEGIVVSDVPEINFGLVFMNERIEPLDP